jgi:predicted lipoprotein
MSTSAAPLPKPNTVSRRRWVAAAAVIVLLGAMALDTKIVKIGSEDDVRKVAFSPEAYGQTEFPKVQADIESRAVEAVTLATAIASDRATAEKEYGIAAGAGPVMSVKLSGVAGEAKSGIYDLAVPGLPEGLRVRVQTGPAINGTELRDATGKITFGQFTNQIEYQDAGSALNSEMKKQVLSKVDTKAMSGKTVSVVGAFKLVNPKSWLITPVRLDVQ